MLGQMLTLLGGQFQQHHSAQDQPGLEAPTGKPPEEPEPCRVDQRPPTQCCGSPPLDAKQEPSRNKSSSRERAPEREHPATGASKEEPGNTQSEDTREEDVDSRRRGMKQLPDRQEANEDRPPEGSDPRRVV